MKILLHLGSLLVFSIFFSTNFLLNAMDPAHSDKNDYKEMIEENEEENELNEDLKGIDVDCKQASILAIIQRAIKYKPTYLNTEQKSILENYLGQRKTLNLSSVNALNDDVFALLHKKPLLKLRELNLTNCSELTSITGLLKQCPNLTTLILTGCISLKRETLAHIAKHCKNLTVINLSHCRQFFHNDFKSLLKMKLLTHINIVDTFMMIYHLSDEEKQRIRQHIKKKGITLIESSTLSLYLSQCCCIF